MKKEDETKTRREELQEQYPDVPSCIWDIEESDEMAAIYYEQFRH